MDGPRFAKLCRETGVQVRTAGTAGACVCELAAVSMWSSTWHAHWTAMSPETAAPTRCPPYQSQFSCPILLSPQGGRLNSVAVDIIFSSVKAKVETLQPLRCVCTVAVCWLL